MAALKFLNPQALALLWVLPPLVVLFVWYAWLRQKRAAENFGEWHLYRHFSQPLTRLRYFVKAAALSLAIAALIIAVARPSLMDATIEYPIGTVDVVVVVDVSRSMAVPDYEGKIPGDGYRNGTRLDMARYLIAHDIMPALGYNQLGAVAFAGRAFPKAFLTDDMPSLKWQLDRTLTIGSAPGEGSQLAEAFLMAAVLFDLDSPSSHRRVVVLFSDGGNDSPDAKLIAAMKELKRRGIDLIIAGVGGKEARPVPVKFLSESDRSEFSGLEWYTMDGEIPRSALDEVMLVAIKNAIGGRYVRVEGVSDFHIGSLISGVDVKYIKGERELFVIPLRIALFLILLALLAPREFAWRDRSSDKRKSQSGQP